MRSLRGALEERGILQRTITICIESWRAALSSAPWTLRSGAGSSSISPGVRIAGARWRPWHPSRGCWPEWTPRMRSRSPSRWPTGLRHGRDPSGDRWTRAAVGGVGWLPPLRCSSS
jgi:hypothetical protein